MKFNATLLVIILAVGCLLTACANGTGTTTSTTSTQTSASTAASTTPTQDTRPFIIH